MNKYGVLVISHGSSKPDWVKLVDEAVQGIQISEELPILSSFLEMVEGRSIQEGIHKLEGLGVTDIIVVPLFISSGSTHIDEISYALGEIPESVSGTNMEPFEIQARIHLCSPIDDDPLIVEIIYSKIAELSSNPEQEIVLLIGHGSDVKGFHLKWRRVLESLAEQLKQRGSFDVVDVAMLLPDQTSRKMEWWRKHKPDHQIIAAPVFISEGYFTRKVIPSRLENYNYRYNGKTMLPSPLVSRWMEAQISRFVKINDPN